MVSDQEVIFRLFLAVLFSGLIGLEREVSGRAAGFRTHILVCVGSTLVMLTAIHLMDLYQGMASIDPGRVAAQVVSGIGFLGAGTIIRFGGSVRGLTTAASIWAVGGVGIAMAVGFYSGALLTGLIVIVTLFLLSPVERAIRSQHKESEAKQGSRG